MSSPSEARTWRTPGCFKDFQSFQSCMHAAEGWNTPIQCLVWNRMFLSCFNSQPALCSSSVPEHVHYSYPRRQDCYVESWRKKNNISDSGKGSMEVFHRVQLLQSLSLMPWFLRKFLRVVRTLPVSQRWQSDLFALMTTEVLFFSISNAETKNNNNKKIILRRNP